MSAYVSYGLSALTVLGGCGDSTRGRWLFQRSQGGSSRLRAGQGFSHEKTLRLRAWNRGVEGMSPKKMSEKGIGANAQDESPLDTQRRLLSELYDVVEPWTNDDM